ncbi:Methyltransferase type 11 [Stigmatella aurantiaca DW4/3-1]|uniref:Methyltransferase type 11 n=1 Tax=Stigmatella aurantiaca (strain DW4/3-1) TaxID=378806 RepID=E3FT66_STIAD|nr:Methyltransferase type 11 [Stigmatella aurantiaca DW4/3-1]
MNGKPVLVKGIQKLHVTPPSEEKISQNIASYSVPQALTDPQAVILHLGSGNVPCADPRVISLDILPCKNADMVAEAEALPFQDGTIDYVESSAVFEHLYDPVAAIAEVKRVLKPGGFFRIDTAFMQGYHGFPGHYFNMTPQAVEAVLADDFLLTQAYVPDSATPLMTTLSLLDRFLVFLAPEDKARLLEMPLTQVLEQMRADTTRRNPLLSSFDEFSHRSLAASFVVEARKPAHYEARLEALVQAGPPHVGRWHALKREYYTARMELMLRHHEVLFYRRHSQHRGRGEPGILEPESLPTLLARCQVADPLDPASLEEALERFRQAEKPLRAIRDQWISRYLQAAPPAAAAAASPLLQGLREQWVNRLRSRGRSAVGRLSRLKRRFLSGA